MLGISLQHLIARSQKTPTHLCAHHPLTHIFSHTLHTSRHSPSRTSPLPPHTSHAFSHLPAQADEYETDEEDGGRMGLVKDEDVRSSISSKRSARSRK